MSRKLYVGNLPYTYTDLQLEDLFSGIGKVTKARVIMDRATNRARGFGFVEMDSEALAEEALNKMNDFEVNGRKLKISYAREQNRTSGRPQSPMIEFR